MEYFDGLDLLFRFALKIDIIFAPIINVVNHLNLPNTGSLLSAREPFGQPDLPFLRIQQQSRRRSNLIGLAQLKVRNVRLERTTLQILVHVRRLQIRVLVLIG